jgi:hypothetical protein
LLEEVKHVFSSLLQVGGIGEGGKWSFFREEINLEYISFLHGVWKVAAIAAIMFQRGADVPSHFSVLTERSSGFGSHMGDNFGTGGS